MRHLEPADNVDRVPIEVTRETWDWTAEMRRVARAFRGREGVVLQFGDSITLAVPNVMWARAARPSQSAEERAFLTWAHAGDRTDRDGWYLAVAMPDGEQGRKSFTAAMGCSAHYLLTGKKGLPPLADMLATYRPQMALYAVGTSDVIRGTPPTDFVQHVAAGIDVLEDHGTIPMLATITPLREHSDAVRRLNDELRALAKRRRLPLVDIYAEMERLHDDVLVFLEPDGVHLTFDEAADAPTAENFLRSGYLLRCYMIVRKAMDVKARVLDR